MLETGPLDREERAACRDAQKIQAEADERKADEINIAKINADRPKTETDRQRGKAKVEAYKEITLKEKEFQAKAQANTIATDILSPGHGYAKSLELPFFWMRGMNWTLNCFVSNIRLRMSTRRKTCAPFS